MSLALIAHPAAIMLAKSSGITLDPVAKPIAAVLAFFYSLIPNYAAAIIMLTIAVMIILTPLTIKQTRSMLVMQKLQPEMKRLQEEHKNDRQALNEAVMALYKEHNASPLGGCLPMLLPFPVFIALFRILEQLTRKVKGKVQPKYLTASTQMYKDIVHQGGTLKSFGMDLAKSAANVHGDFGSKLPYFVLVLLMVGTQYYQQRQLTSRNPQAAQGQQAQIMKFFPLLFGVFAIRFPAGVIVYWTVSNAIRIFQQWAMYQFDPKVKALVAQDIREVEAKTREIDDAKPTRPRFRDLLSGGANPPANPKPAAKPTKAGGARPIGNKPAASKPGTAKPTGNKATPASSKPTGSKATPTGKAPPPGGKTPARGNAGKSNPPLTPKPAPAVGADDRPPNGAPRTDAAPSTNGDGAGGANGAPRGRTGAGGARTGGNRGKRTRRGR